MPDYCLSPLWGI